MATTTTPKMTAEEFYEWASRPENEGKRLELEDGRVVEMPSPGERHCAVCWLLGLILGQYLFRRGVGHMTTNDSGLVIKRHPDTVRGPDVMLFLAPKKFEELSPGYTTDTPALVAEVLSPTDRHNKTLRRVAQYHARGVPLVWVIDPEDLTVTTYRPKEFPKVLDESDELTGNGALPDFACHVRDLFTLPGQQPPAPAA